MGRPTVSQLIGAGHTVVGLAGRAESAHVLESLGAKAALADALDERAVARAVADARPHAIVHQLTSLPSNYTAEEMQSSAERDRRVRLEGGANLVKAARASGVRRFIISSGAYFDAPGEGLADEEAPFAIDATPGVAASARLMAELERLVLDEAQLDGIALRYGFFYGPRTWYWPDVIWRRKCGRVNSPSSVRGAASGRSCTWTMRRLQLLSWSTASDPVASTT